MRSRCAISQRQGEHPVAIWTRIAILITVLSHTSSARAQHASDNPVASADDAFGLTLGLESIGMYGPGGIRGFNPQVAGNVRINGLYFDQQAALSNRVVEGSTIRVGVSEIGYAFPAPTGIVDYDLRHPGNGKPSVTIVTSAGPFEAKGVSADGNLPVMDKQLQLPLGASYQVSTQTPITINPGYTSKVANFGGTPQWSPNDRWTFRGIFDWQQTTKAKTFPFVFTAGDFLPPKIRRGYLGQDWAEGHSKSENYGATVSGQLNEQWSLAAGLFRSISDNPVSFSDLYVNTDPKGLADHLLIGYPDQSVTSTSGEIRLTGRFSASSWHHSVVALARGRDTLAYFGGEDVVDTGPALISQGLQVREPAFRFSDRTSDRTQLWSTGLGYRGQWDKYADFAFGLQQEHYSKAVTSPGAPQARLSDRPVRIYGQASMALGERLTAYTGYTQGLEDSGVASNGAVNRGAILPAARTWQADAGVRYSLTSRVKVIAGVFQIDKPYFNLDTKAVDRALGVQRAKAVELSVSGEVVKNLHLAAGVLLGEVEIVGPNLSAEGVGHIAFGQPHWTSVINADYAFSWWPSLSADLSVMYFGDAPASINNAFINPAITTFALGGRYKFHLLGSPATLRIQGNNVTNYYYWNMTYTPGFSQWPPRSLSGYLTADF
jgi:iron complex outermembrane recepter protein